MWFASLASVLVAQKPTHTDLPLWRQANNSELHVSDI